MTRYFSVITDSLTKDQERAFGEVIKRYAWWHWLPNYWLLRDTTETITAAWLRDTIKELSPSAQCMVIQMQPNDWASLGAPATDEVRRSWLKEYWPPEGK